MDDAPKVAPVRGARVFRQQQAQADGCEKQAKKADENAGKKINAHGRIYLEVYAGSCNCCSDDAALAQFAEPVRALHPARRSHREMCESAL
ncbi:MAG: hypothetical protein ABSA13_16490 [Beijerinckiaceae bacterium]